MTFFVVALIALGVFGLLAILRDGSDREDAWDELTAMRRRQWDRERYEANPDLRRPR